MLRLAASLLLVALVAAELGEAETQQGQPPDEKLVKPIMVKRLPTAGEAAAISTGLLPVEKSPFAADEASLAEVRKRQQSQLKSIQKQLVEGYKQRDNLLLTQKLMTAVIGLHKAERMLASVEGKLKVAKGNVKKFAEQADEVLSSSRRNDAERQKERVRAAKRIAEASAKAAEEATALKGLVARREKVANAAAKWKEHVEELRDLQLALASGGDSLPVPPALGPVPSAPSGTAFSTDSSVLPPSLRTPALDAVVSGKTSRGKVDAAVGELMHQTWQSLGVDRARFRGAALESGAEDEEAEAANAALDAAAAEQRSEEDALAGEAEAFDTAEADVESQE